MYLSHNSFPCSIPHGIRRRFAHSFKWNSPRRNSALTLRWHLLTLCITATKTEQRNEKNYDRTFAKRNGQNCTQRWYLPIFHSYLLILLYSLTTDLKGCELVTYNIIECKKKEEKKYIRNPTCKLLLSSHPPWAHIFFPRDGIILWFYGPFNIIIRRLLYHMYDLQKKDKEREDWKRFVHMQFSDRFAIIFC